MGGRWGVGGSEERLEAGPAQPSDLAGNLRDMERLGRLLGVERGCARFLARAVPAGGRGARVLDLATGSGWLARALLSRRGDQAPWAFTAADRHPAVLAEARRQTPRACPVSFVRADARRLPFGDRAFDAALCAMTLHHFAPPEALALIREIDRVSRRGWFLCDLVRSPLTRGLAWISVRWVSQNPLTRHDGPLSARRAYPWAGFLALLSEAGVQGAAAARLSPVLAALWRAPDP